MFIKKKKKKTMSLYYSFKNCSVSL